MYIYQIRSWNINNIVAMAGSQYANNGIPMGVAPIITTSNVDIIKDALTPADVVDSWLADEKVRPNGQVIVGELKKTWAEIADRLKSYPMTASTAVFSGCHRVMASAIVWTFTNSLFDYVNQSFTGTFDEIHAMALQGNVLHALNSKMSKKEQLESLVQLVKNGVYTKAKDLLCMYKHGTSTYMFAMAYLVAFYDVTIDEALAIPSKDVGRIRQLNNPEAIREAVNAVLDGTEGTKAPTISKKDYAEVLSLSRSESMKILAESIVNGDIAEFRKVTMIFDYIFRRHEKEYIKLYSKSSAEITDTIFSEAKERLEAKK